MKYSIDWLKQMVNKINPSWRSVSVMDLVWSWLKGLRDLWSQFGGFRTFVIDEIGKNGQVVVLEKLLNDGFDTTLRRIFIGDYSAGATQALWLESENQASPAVWLDSEIPPGQGLPLLLDSEAS